MAADPAGGAEPQRMSMLGLVEKFRSVHEKMPARKFCFVLGAGASVTSGINSANRMVGEWIATIYRESVGHTGPVPPDWACDATLRITGFDRKDPAASYSALYRRMYENDPAEGYAYLEAQMEKAEPSFGYSVLGRILADTRHGLVITVNFDNLVADSVSLFTKTYPMVCGHELLLPFMTAQVGRPRVLKVHRDLLLGPKSRPDEIGTIDTGLRDTIRLLLKEYTPIVIGYGGNDGSLMSCLEGLEDPIPGGIYWCYRDGVPPERIRKVVARHNGYLVPVMGFDELLMQFGNELKYPVPHQYVLDRAQERADRIVKQAKELADRIKERDAAALAESAAPKPDMQAGDKGDTSAASAAMSNTMRRKEGRKRWWHWDAEAEAEPDIAKRDIIYRKAVEKLPKSSDMLNCYGVFLFDIRKDKEAAGAIFERAVAVGPKDVVTLGNYANFLTDYRKDHDAAGVMYERAIAADPDYAIHLGNYARFLADVRKDKEAAGAMFERAVAADPNETINLGNYARFLLTAGRVAEGLNRLDQAIAKRVEGKPDALVVECWMYAYCCRPKERRAEALGHIKLLVTTTDIRTDNWDFSGVIAQAKTMKHSEAKWLPKLAEVIAGRAEPATLKAWKAWQAAGETGPTPEARS